MRNFHLFDICLRQWWRRGQLPKCWRRCRVTMTRILWWTHVIGHVLPTCHTSVRSREMSMTSNILTMIGTIFFNVIFVERKDSFYYCILSSFLSSFLISANKNQSKNNFQLISFTRMLQLSSRAKFPVFSHLFSIQY